MTDDPAVPVLPRRLGIPGRRSALAALTVLAAPLVVIAANTPLLPARRTATTGQDAPRSPGGPSSSGGSGGSGVQIVSPRIGSLAPSFWLSDPEGRPMQLGQFRGRSVVLNFWATWCAPCRVEMPELELLHRRYKDEAGLVVLGVSVDDASSVSQVARYIQAGDPHTGPYTFPVALDTKRDVLGLYRVTGVPSTFFIDGAGIIRSIHPGVMSPQLLLEHLGSILTLP